MTKSRALPRASRISRLLAMGLAAAVMSCAPRPVTLGQTQIGQGKLYQSGNVTYDRFFQDTHAVQLEVMRADEDEAQARAPLEKALDARGASLDKLYELALTRARKGGEDVPPIVYVTVSGLDPNKETAKEPAKDDKEPVDNGEAPKGEPPKEGNKEGAKSAPAEPKDGARKIAVSVIPLDNLPADQKAFVKGLTDTARGEAEILDRFGPIMSKAAQLSAQSDELADGVDREFSARKLRRDVNQELGAAKLILGATEEKAREISNRARAFLKGLSEALKPPAEAPLPPPPPAAEKPTVAKPAKPRRVGGAKPAKPAGDEAPAPRPSAPPAPKPAKPKPAEDFNP